LANVLISSDIAADLQVFSYDVLTFSPVLKRERLRQDTIFPSLEVALHYRKRGKKNETTYTRRH
jgi:hypothetical protein